MWKLLSKFSHHRYKRVVLCIFHIKVQRVAKVRREISQLENINRPHWFSRFTSYDLKSFFFSSPLFIFFLSFLHTQVTRFVQGILKKKLFLTFSYLTGKKPDYHESLTSDLFGNWRNFAKYLLFVAIKVKLLFPLLRMICWRKSEALNNIIFLMCKVVGK